MERPRIGSSDCRPAPVDRPVPPAHPRAGAGIQPPEGVAEFAGALLRGLERPHERRLHRIAVERGDRGLRGAALGGHALAAGPWAGRRCGWRATSHRRTWPGPTAAPGPRTAPSRPRPESRPRARRTHRPDQSPTVRSRHRADLRARPRATGRWRPARPRRDPRSSDETAGRANSPVMPSPISAGVLGIARTDAIAAGGLDQRIAADPGHHTELQGVAHERRTKGPRLRRTTGA